MISRSAIISVPIFLGLIWLLMCPRICRFDAAYLSALESDIKILTKQTKLFHEDKGYLPAKLEELIPHYISHIPKDPWGNDYIYSSINGEPFLKSLGENGVLGGNGLSQDFHSNTNWEKARNEI